MNEFQFDAQKPYTFVRYARMSSELQNPLSPERQYDEIARTLESLRYPWRHLADYRDDAVSGKLLRRRPGLQQMLTDFDSGARRPDLVLLDTSERLGRIDEVNDLKRGLFKRHGILVLSADDRFSDPTTPQGETFSLIQNWRAREENRIKAHQVRSGKILVAKAGHWAGARPPFGYRLNPVSTTCARTGRESRFSTLVVDPKTGPIVRRLFAKALETGWGQDRLARWLNEDEDVPGEYKPFLGSTVGRWLGRPIYTGELVFNRVRADVVDDVRVIQHKPEEEWVRVNDFCEPLVARGDFETLQRVRRIRGDRVRKGARGADEFRDKLIRPLTPGKTLKYVLSGLVHCGTCGRAMRPTGSAPYVKVSGEAQRYPSYSCQSARSGACTNRRGFKEPPLRREVVARLLDRLLGPLSRTAESSADELREISWFRELAEEVQRAWEARHHGDAGLAPTLRAELQEIERRLAGWLTVLGDPDMPAALKKDVSVKYAEQKTRLDELDVRLSSLRSLDARRERLLDPHVVLDRLRHLDRVMASNNPTLGNLLLAEHIASVTCHDDGRIVLKICKLGSVRETAEILAARPDVAASDASPRRRLSRRRVAHADEAVAPASFVDWTTDPKRFDGLGPEWFWEDEFSLPDDARGWAARNAEAVFARWMELRSARRTAKEFDVSPPTIHAALAHYQDRHPELDWPSLQARVRGGRRPGLAAPVYQEIGEEALRLWDAHVSVLRIARILGCSGATVEQGVAWACERLGRPVPAEADRCATRVRRAREMLEAGAGLAAISEELGVSDVTARAYLRRSFEAEGATMPDLRRRAR